MSKRLHRRTLLRGAAGAALALPMLEIMVPSQTAADTPTAPCRFLFSFAGISIGTHEDFVVPNREGGDYDLKRGLSPLGDLCEVSSLPGFNVRDEVSVVSNLTIPWATDGSAPAGGRQGGSWHPEQTPPLLCGMRHTASGQNTPRGPTPDQIAADALGGRSLVYRVQPVNYRGGNGSGGTQGRLSYRQDGSSINSVQAVASPRQAYDAMFSTFASDDPEEEAQREFELSRRRSILDLVGRTQRDRLLNRLGGPDHRRMEQHFDHLRDIETRLDGATTVGAGACQMLADPGADPAIGGISRVAGGGNPFFIDQGYSGEEERARIMSDLIHMAFACDLNRSASLMYTMEQCYMMPNRLPGISHNVDMHAVSHGGQEDGRASRSDRPRAMSDLIAWHTRHFAYLVDKMRSTQDGPDGTLLDHSALIFVPEGGRGFDPGAGKEDSPHSSENMVMLLAGRAGGLRPGQHIVAGSGADHPGNVILTALQAVGVETDSFGDLSEPILALRA